MEWWLIISLLFGGMVLLLLTNLPIGLAVSRGQHGGGLFFSGGSGRPIGIVTGVFTSITTFTLLRVPFFILMGKSSSFRHGAHAVMCWINGWADSGQTLDPGCPDGVIIGGVERLHDPQHAPFSGRSSCPTC